MLKDTNNTLTKPVTSPVDFLGEHSAKAEVQPVSGNT